MVVRRQKVRMDPRFGINAMMKYMHATPTQRAKLIQQQKYPPDFQVIYYEDACRAISRFIVKGMSDESILSREIARLDNAIPANDGEAQKFTNNIEAIRAFARSYSQIPLDGLSAKWGDNSSPKLLLSGVELSINPDVELSGKINGKDCVGAIKLYFSKDEPLTDSMAKYGSVLLHSYVASHLAGEVWASPKHAIVFDVFAGTGVAAPRAYTKRVHKAVRGPLSGV
jgi:hypothetical protein